MNDAIGQVGLFTFGSAPEERHVYRNKASSSIPNPLIRDGKAKKGERI
jgi:hypothetical protein